MKSISAYLVLAALLIASSPQPMSAQLLPEQRLQDFQNLVALYVKRYAPYDWKRQALGFDLFDIQPWLERVQAAKDDLEFFEIEAEYVGRLQDTHSSFSMTSSFRANLGMTVDIYDDKVLIDTINRTVLPTVSYPFQIGDELVSVDGVSSEDWIRRISVWRQWGNPVSTRRQAAAQITLRMQSSFPRAIDIGDTAVVEIRRANGVLERYTIPWTKAGVPVTKVGPVGFPKALSRLEDSTGEPDFLKGLEELHNYKLPASDLVLSPVPWSSDQNGSERTYVNGLGSAVPVFRGGFPSNFVQRLNGLSTFHYSGTFLADGLTIGYLRFPSFSPPTNAAVTELRAEIDFLQKNTDGLVVDVMRNPGGGCYMLDAAATLISYPFYFFGEQLRPTQSLLNAYQSILESAVAGRADSWVISTYQIYRDAVKAALEADRGMTDPIAACTQVSSSRPPLMNDNVPAPAPYKKPMIVLIDEFSISAADIFPAMIQDNKRALLVGARTSGGGGSVSGWPTGLYSESSSNNTNSLVVRKTPIATDDYPIAPYVENIGARPDIALNYMTRENLLNGGRTFVNQFTQVLINQIRKPPVPETFTISNSGGVSWNTAGTSEPIVVGYGRIQPDNGNTTPSGLAIIGSHSSTSSGNVLVSEAAIPASPLISSGRIYAEIEGGVNTGVAIANPNNQPATVSFYFTGPTGNFGSGVLVVPTNGQVAAFLDQAPFNASKPLAGTLTFSSTVPVAAVALRSLRNERGEFLFTTLPVTDISAAAATGAVVFPDYVDGGGWTTEIILVNPTDSTLAGAIQFFDPAGNQVTTLTVDGQTGINFKLFDFSSRVTKAQDVGFATIGADWFGACFSCDKWSESGAIVVSLRQNNVTVTEAGITASNSSLAFRVYVEASGDFPRGLAGSVQTGLAISNTSNTELTVTLELNRLDGSTTGLKGTIQLPANGQVSEFLYQIPGLASMPLPFQGVMRISSPVPISVVGLRARYNERRDFLIATIPPADEDMAPHNKELFFPHFVESGAYTTQFILFSGSAGQQSSGVLRFASQTGGALNLMLH